MADKKLHDSTAANSTVLATSNTPATAATAPATFLSTPTDTHKKLKSNTNYVNRSKKRHGVAVHHGVDPDGKEVEEPQHYSWNPTPSSPTKLIEVSTHTPDTVKRNSRSTWTRTPIQKIAKIPFSKEKKLAIDHKKMLQNRTSVDLTIDMSGKLLFAHKFIVQTRCPLFFSTFVKKRHHLKSKRPMKIEVDEKCGITRKAMELLLEYFYGGSINFEPVDLAEIIELMAGAKILNIEVLLRMCQRHLLKSLSTSNWFKIFKYSDSLSMEEGKVMCLLWASRNFPTLVTMKSSIIELGIDLFHEVVVYVTLGLKTDYPPNSNQLAIDSQDIMRKDFKKIFKDMEDPDSSFMIDNEVIPCHASLLLGQSQSLSKLLKKSFENVIPKKYSWLNNKQTLLGLLRFLYYRKVPVFLDAEIALRLFHFASDLELSALSKVCDQFLTGGNQRSYTDRGDRKFLKKVEIKPKSAPGSSSSDTEEKKPSEPPPVPINLALRTKSQDALISKVAKLKEHPARTPNSPPPTPFKESTTIATEPPARKAPRQRSLSNVLPLNLNTPERIGDKEESPKIEIPQIRSSPSLIGNDNICFVEYRNSFKLPPLPTLVIPPLRRIDVTLVKTFNQNGKVWTAKKVDNFIYAGGVKTVNVWDIEKSSSILEIPIEGVVNCMDISEDNKCIVVGGGANNSRGGLWRFSNLISASEEATNALSDDEEDKLTSPTSNKIGFPSHKKPTPPNPLHTPSTPANTLHRPKVSVKRTGGVLSGEELFLCVRIIDKTGNKFVSGAHDSQIVLWDMNTKVEKYLLGHTGPVWAIDVSPNKLWIVSAGDLTIKLWSLESLECKLTFTGHKKPISCVKFLDDHSIVSGSQDHTLRIWDIRTGACTVLYGHTKEVLCMAFHRDLVITGSADGTVRFWQPKTQECHLILNAHTQSISSLEVYEDTLVTSSRDGSVKLFKIT